MGARADAPRKVDDADAAKARQLSDKGIAATDIAKMLGVSRATAYRYLREESAARNLRNRSPCWTPATALWMPGQSGGYADPAGQDLRSMQPGTEGPLASYCFKGTKPSPPSPVQRFGRSAPLAEGRAYHVLTMSIDASVNGIRRVERQTRGPWRRRLE